MGRKRRRLSIIAPAVAFGLFVAFMIVREIAGLGFWLPYLLMLASILLLSFLFNRWMRKENNKMKPIGELEFRTDRIIKQIGDSSVEYGYDSVKQIMLEKYIPVVDASGYLSHVLTISFMDKRNEKLVISDRPTDKSHSIGISETLNTLNKIRRIQVIHG